MNYHYAKDIGEFLLLYVKMKPNPKKNIVNLHKKLNSIENQMDEYEEQYYSPYYQAASGWEGVKGKTAKEMIADFDDDFLAEVIEEGVAELRKRKLKKL